MSRGGGEGGVDAPRGAGDTDRLLSLLLLLLLLLLGAFPLPAVRGVDARAALRRDARRDSLSCM